MKGMKELCQKGFIAEAMSQGKYFLNPDYMFNGDRLAFIKQVRIKGHKYEDPRQQALPLEEQPPKAIGGQGRTLDQANTEPLNLPMSELDF